MIECLPAMQETWVRSLGWEDPLEKGMATDSCILAWRIPWTEKPVGLKSMGLQKKSYRTEWLTLLFFWFGQYAVISSCCSHCHVWGQGLCEGTVEGLACKRTVTSLLFSSRSALGLSGSCKCTISCPEHPGLVEGGGAAPKIFSLAGSCLHGLGGETPLFKHDQW